MQDQGSSIDSYRRHTDKAFYDRRNYKKHLDGVNCLCPMPTVLPGTVVGEKTNFLTIVHVGIMNFGTPHYISISSVKIHYSNDLFIGEIVHAYCEEAVFADGELDFAKVKPMRFDMPRKKCWSLGEPFADCWKISLAWKPEG